MANLGAFSISVAVTERAGETRDDVPNVLHVTPNGLQSKEVHAVSNSSIVPSTCFPSELAAPDRASLIEAEAALSRACLVSSPSTTTTIAAQDLAEHLDELQALIDYLRSLTTTERH